MTDDAPGRARGSRLAAVALVGAAAFGLGAGCAALGHAPDVVFLTSSVGYEFAARPSLHGALVAANFLGFAFVGLGGVRLPMALARRGWLFVVVGGGMLVAGLGASLGAAVPEPLGGRGRGPLAARRARAAL